MNLPAYTPDSNADEAIWEWAREEATGNLRLGTEPAVQERVSEFLAGMADRKNEVRRHSQDTPRPIPSYPQMHIPSWLWFK